MLTAKQDLMVRATLAVAAKTGQFDKTRGPAGAQYVPALMNSAKSDGFACHECAFWLEDRRCAVVRGDIEPEGLCKLNVIPHHKMVAR